MKLTEIERLGHFVELERLNENSVIVDAGACTGEFIEKIRKLINCKILAIEPSEKNFEKLKEKNFFGVELYHFALVGNNQSGIMNLYLYPQNEWGNLFYLYRGSNAIEEVKTIKLKDLYLPRIDYLKLDIEGAEKSLFEEMTQEEADTIQQMSIELHNNCDIKTMKKLIGGLGFTVREMPRNELYAWRPKAFKHIYGDRPAKYAKMSDTCARSYSQEWTEDWFKDNVFMHIEPADSVLDVGCGNGRMVGLFRQYFKRIVGIEVFHYDFNSYVEYDELIKGDFEVYDFSEQFDYVCFFASLYQMRIPLEAVRKAMELLKDGGTIVVMDATKRENPHDNYYYDLHDICQELGLNFKHRDIVQEINITYITK